METRLQALVMAIDKLDRENREPRVQSRNPAVLKLAEDSGRFVFELRQVSRSILGPRGVAPYDPTNYFHALLFYYLKALSRPMVQNDPLRLRVVLVAASLAEQTLRDVKAGHYGKKKGKLFFARTWPAGLFHATRPLDIAVRGRARHVSASPRQPVAADLYVHPSGRFQRDGDLWKEYEKDVLKYVFKAGITVPTR